MTHVRLPVLLGLLGIVGGCGQKGALMLPDTNHPHKKSGSPAAAPRTTPAPQDTPQPDKVVPDSMPQR